MSLPFSDKTDQNPPCYSVSEITEKIHQCLTQGFSFFQVKGEISNFTPATSGHWYFTLKDSQSQIRVVMFLRDNKKLNWQPKNGLEATVYGQIGVYKPRGEYQIICQDIVRKGKGALQEEFEKLKEKLNQEGFFKRKNPLPFLPQHIGIITSPSGAAIRDILNILKKKQKGIQVTVIPALVQGESAPESLISALKKAEKLKDIDVLILTRGGGSMEDLWAFNDESLARTLYTFPKPVISAVGHEIDFTISDFVADVRAPTPTAGAELVVKEASDLNQKLQKTTFLLFQNIKRELKFLHDKCTSLKCLSPSKKIQDFQQNLDELNANLKKNFLNQNYLRKQELKRMVSLIENVNPLKILSRGYCMVSKKEKIIKSAKELKKGEEVHIQFSESVALTRVLHTRLSALPKIRSK